MPSSSSGTRYVRVPKFRRAGKCDLQCLLEPCTTLSGRISGSTAGRVGQHANLLPLHCASPLEDVPQFINDRRRHAVPETTLIISAADPVRSGLVASLSRPGGNIAGFSIVGPELDAKRLTLLRELLPAVQRVGVLELSTNPYWRAVRKEFEQRCRSLGLQPIIIEVAAAGELENAIAEMARRRAQALFVQSETVFYNNRVPLMGAALRYALPTLGTYKEMLEAGALVSYAYNQAESYQRYAAFVDRILRGAKPADLPIEQPTKFDLGINLKTAKALGITVSQSVLLRADEVIQ